MIGLIVLFSLCVYRVTRFVISDSLIEGTRTRIQDKLIDGEPGLVRDKIYELSTCAYCMSIWVAGITVTLAQIWVDVPLPVLVWLASAGGCMVVWRFVETFED